MNIKNIIIGLLVCLLTACGSVNKTTTTKYDASGNVVEVVVTESDTSDFASYLASGKDNATDLRGDISKFNLGWNGYGLSWLSISGGRTKAPVNSNSTSAEALEKMADVIKANKTVVDAGDVSVNKSTSTQ